MLVSNIFLHLASKIMCGSRSTELRRKKDTALEIEHPAVRSRWSWIVEEEGQQTQRKLMETMENL